MWLRSSMILSCPACEKKYLVPDTAVGPQGRQVRCAACRHSWFEAPPAYLLDPVPPPELPQLAAELSNIPWPAAAVDGEASALGTPKKEEVATADPAADLYAPTPPFRARRNPRYWTVVAIIISLLLIAGIGAVYYFASPTLFARLGFPVGPVDTPLITQFVSDRGPKEGMETTPPYVTIHGKIMNPTHTPQRVPDIIAELLDSHDRVVYSWTITPERRTIAADGILPIDDTAANIPLSARQTRLTFSGADPR